MRLITLLVVLITAAPALAQPSRLRVWTNADLGQPLTPARPTVTPEQLASLAAHQFVYLPPTRTIDPGVFVIRSSATAGPFGEFAPFGPPRRLDGSSWLDPSMVYGLPPWFALGSGYPYQGYQGYRDVARREVSDRRPSDAGPAAVPAPRPLTSPPARPGGRVLR